MDYNNDLSKAESCSSGQAGAAPNSLNMNIRRPGRREPVESDENDPMNGSLLNSQVSCVDNTAVAEHDVCCYPGGNDPSAAEPVVCIRVIPDEEYDQCGPPMDWTDRTPRQCPPQIGEPHQPMAVAGAEWGGARPKVIIPDSRDRYQKYADYQVKILSNSARKFLSRQLNYSIEANSAQGYMKTWEGLAQLMGKDYAYTESLRDCVKDPFSELLKDWQTERGSTIGTLVDYLNLCDRYDILDDKEFFMLMQRSVEDHNSRARKTDEDFKRQDRNKAPVGHMTVADGLTEEEKTYAFIRIRLVEGKAPMMYDAFICYEEGDEGFVMEMIRELEIRDGHSLCLNARDLLIGHPNEQVVTAELIKSRCEKTIVVLSPMFVRPDSEMCQFAMNVSHSLNPAARKSKIVPVMAQVCEIPPSLCHITPVDFTRSLERTWQWRKVSACLRNCHELLNFMEKASLRNITLRAPHRSVDLRASVRASMHAGDTGTLSAGTVIISTSPDTTTAAVKKTIQGDDTSLNSTSSSEGADDDNIDDTDGMAARPETVNPREKDKKKDKDKAREKKKNAKRNFHFSRFFRNS